MWGPGRPPDVQQSHGLTSCSEWTGVPLSVLLTEAGARAGSSWLLVEGADACKMQRSVPIQKAMDDAIVAYGQNGEALSAGTGISGPSRPAGVGGQYERPSGCDGSRSGTVLT